MKLLKTLPLLMMLFTSACVRTYMVPQEVITQRITHEKLSHKESMSLASVLTIPLGVVITNIEANLRRDSDLN